MTALRRIPTRYVDPADVRLAVANSCGEGGGRAWRFGGAWRSLRTKRERVKTIFADPHATAEYIEALRRSPRLFGRDPAPSSYAWSWMQLFAPPRTPATVLARIGHDYSMPSAWNEAMEVGAWPGEWFVYDLRSAYHWAALDPMPALSSAVLRDDGRGPRERNGLYLVDADWSAPRVPWRLRSCREAKRPAWVTREEFDAFDPHHTRIVRSIEFSRTFSLSRTFDTLERALNPHAFKRMSKIFWGAWASTAQVEEHRTCASGVRLTRRLPSRYYCPIWAWIIQGRINARIAEVRDFVHVYTDGVVVPMHLQEERERVGGWKLERTLHDPWVSGTGMYGDKSEVTKHMGVACGKVLSVEHYRDAAIRAQISRASDETERESAESGTYGGP